MEINEIKSKIDDLKLSMAVLKKELEKLEREVSESGFDCGDFNQILSDKKKLELMNRNLIEEVAKALDSVEQE